jgi:transposase
LDTHSFSAFAGVDLGSREHEACLIDATGKRRGRRFPHSAEGLASLVAWLAGDIPAATLAVALEVPHGPVVEALQDAGIAVFSINPKQLDRFRDRHSVAGAKDDRLDAFVLADALRSDLHKFKPVPPLDPFIRELREVSRTYEDLGQDLHANANRLWRQLTDVAPHLLALCPGADEPWFWDLCERALVHQARPDRRWIRTLLQRHRKRALSADAVMEALRVPLLAASSLAAYRFRISTLLPVLRVLFEQRLLARRTLARLLQQAGRPAEIIDSHKGIDLVIATTFLAEASTAVATADLETLRTLSGTAPVTRRSGKSQTVGMRRACNPRLRNAVRNWALTAMTWDPRGRYLYRNLRARGHSHERALRGLADRLLSCLVATLRDDSLYDPARFRTPETLAIA